ncbi:O-antigen translocase [Undibacterium sp. Jales W-56]|uniref:O-antigen translocase n=1 Tax=Undibacterium sp. Jales W-56 TaxID=2897325 RepID=UPI0021CE1639|nr:O-antigen translocase [Undibacterium sp. Jales W-56]MCU6434599.1 O-antigen translocase [Undibacterium sp. Jales W-56]
MSLVSTGFLNAIAVAMRLLAMLGLNKLLAIYVGPAGYAALGQFQNAITMITSFASGAINTGVTKYTAQYHDETAKQHRLWQTAGSISLACTLLVSTFIAIFHRPLAGILLQDTNLGSVFLWLAATLILFVFNAFLLAVLNGKKAVGRYVIANVSTSIITLLVTWLLSSVWGLYGALVALTINQSVVFFVTLALCMRTNWFRFSDLAGRIDPQLARQLAQYGLMALVTAVALPLSQMLIRDHLVSEFGWFYAGLWQAVTKISDMYLMLITTTLTVYYLPRLSEISEPLQLRQEISKVYRFALPAAAIGALFVYLLREWLVALLFTQDFLPMLDLLAWQLIGDVVKIGSWVLGFVMLGRAMVRAYIITEVVFNFSLVGLTYSLTPWLGLKAAVIAFLINYLLYWLCIAIILKKTGYK